MIGKALALVQRLAVKPLVQQKIEGDMAGHLKGPVVASVARQSMACALSTMDRHGLWPLHEPSVIANVVWQSMNPLFSTMDRRASLAMTNRRPRHCDYRVAFRSRHCERSAAIHGPACSTMIGVEK